MVVAGCSIFIYTKDIKAVSYAPKANKFITLLLKTHNDEVLAKIGKPEVISCYNQAKGGIDAFDQCYYNSNIMLVHYLRKKYILIMLHLLVLSSEGHRKSKKARDLKISPPKYEIYSSSSLPSDVQITKYLLKGNQEILK
ncbi:hypothetical protein HHI36_014308 [Cryptolaemus montrouzieri]|uniref:Uncharacterized protein n=1 Tax=Cryptolaemus montrouzieri TaxID=559131 RepID=A0ABD2N352_9CUCU